MWRLSWPVACLWVALSFAVASACLLGLIHPEWISGSELVLAICDFSGQPSTTSWMTPCTLFGSGCLLLTSGAVFGCLAIGCLSGSSRRSLVLLVGRVQFVAVVAQGCSLLIFPVSLTPDHCSTDDCRLSWSYALAIVGTVLACYCPLLASFIFYEAPDQWTKTGPS